MEYTVLIPIQSSPGGFKLQQSNEPEGYIALWRLHGPDDADTVSAVGRLFLLRGTGFQDDF